MPMNSIENVFKRLSGSSFRSKFKLDEKELKQLKDRGIDDIIDDARFFILTRIAPALPANDGRQTPWKKHPVFVAQHATATCCRKCIAKWHGIPKGRELSDDEQGYIISIIERCLRRWI